jgi:hypothetical protein
VRRGPPRTRKNPPGIVGMPTQGHLKTRRSHGFEPAPRPDRPSPKKTHRRHRNLFGDGVGALAAADTLAAIFRAAEARLLIAATAAARAAADSHRYHRFALLIRAPK